MWGFIKRHYRPGSLLFIFISVLVGLPGHIDDLQEWKRWLEMGIELSWPFWRYLILFISFSGVVVFSLPLFVSLYQKIRAIFVDTQINRKRSRQEHPDCTFAELKDYLAHQVIFGSFSLEASAESICDFQLLSKFLSQKLFEGKVKAWGKETKENKASPVVKLISQEYWEFNRLNFKEEEIDTHSTEETVYTFLLFNQEQMIEQMEFLFSNYEKIQEQLIETRRDEEQGWVELN